MDENDGFNGFGYKMSWLAIPTTDSQAITDALGLRQTAPASWRDGIAAVYEGDSIFVTPPVSGWTLAVGKDMPTAGDEPWIPFLEGVSQKLTHVQYFGTHRGVDYQAWATAQSGRIIRAYSNGEDGVRDIGDKTPEEIALGFNFLGDDATEEDYEAYRARDEAASPDEESVMQIAGKWSINPTSLDPATLTGTGILGTLP